MSESLGGIPGQGPVDNPKSTFYDHAILLSSAIYYDPSYGGSVYPTVAALETFGLFGWSTDINYDLSIWPDTAAQDLISFP